MLMITRYGYDNFSFMLLGGIGLIAAGLFLLDSLLLAVPLLIAGSFLSAFTMWFFRDPRRSIPAEVLENDALVLAPADGKVVQISELQENRFINGPARQLSIFLSPLDVHVNRIPAAGNIAFAEYFPGEFLMAFNHDASEKNEQSVFGLENPNGKIIFKQITGFLARRIVYDIKAGDSVRAGQKFGMMKFGSRMDIIVPAAADILVSEGSSVRGGESIIIKLR